MSEDERDSGTEESPWHEEEGLKKELEGERKRNQELLTRLKYMQADLENYRKRIDREMREAGESSVRSLVSRLLGVLDELALAVKHSEAKEHKGELGEGIRMVESNLEAALESAGVERIDCVAKPFDPALHEAVEKIQGASGAEDVVVEELRPGFTFRGQLIRPSMVKVQLALKAPSGEAKASE